MDNSFLRWLACGAILTLCGAAADGRPPAQVSAPEQKPLAHEVSVTLKLVQVYVTDKKGNPVSGLERDDFIVTDSGRAVTITDFERYVLPPPPAARPERAARPQPAEATAAPAQPGTPRPAKPAISRKYILFFDFAYNNARGFKKGKEAALHFLDREARPGDEVALFSYSLTRGLSVNEFLTSDHKKVRAAVEALGVQNVAGRAEDVEQEYWLQATGQMPALVGDAGGIAWRRQDSKRQAETYILKLTDLAKSLRYVPGQKQLILFSTGIANSLIYGGAAGTPREEPTRAPQTSRAQTALPVELGDRVLIQRYEDLLRELSSSNCAIFSFDTRPGPMVASLFLVDEATFGDVRGAGRDMFTPDGVRLTESTIFREEKWTGLYSLNKLSKDTGGKYYGNIDEYERNLGQVSALTGTYYVLGFPTGQAQDGAFHEIKVEVKRPGCIVRTQSGYFNPKPFREYSDLEKQLQFLDLALSERPLSQSPLALFLSAVSWSAGGDSRLVLIGRLPAATVGRLAGENVEVISLIFDDQDNLTDLNRAEKNLSAFRDNPVIYFSETPLRPGAFRCRLVIRGLETGTAAVASTDAFVHQTPEQGIRLYSPLVLVREEKKGFLEGRQTRQKGAVPAAMSWRDIYSFDAASFSPVAGPIPQGTSELRLAWPCFLSASAGGNLRLTASLLKMPAAEKIGLDLSLVSQTGRDEIDTYFLRLPINRLEAGDYVLYLHAEDVATLATSNAVAQFAIR
ncbi:MAG: VWA domain-containing protein [Candidatus Aminicenantes bacterium]|nr:VWA domain-containing protein [Candidatus Aminicenantes bacterium]